MKRCLLPIFLLLAVVVQAQQVRVPEHIYFADMDLTITKKGQEEIQKYVDYLVRHPESFQLKVDQADTYFPVIQRVFREEGLPDDFKYLVLQESGLIADAVSTSNAVGFWQFKKEAASDMGLAMNGNVDERKHIIESSRAAARFLSKHNLYFNNWLYTVLSHNLGFTGAKNYVDQKYIGKKQLEIDNKAHVYVLKFLAHKVAYENAVGKNPNPSVTLHEMVVNAGESMLDIAQFASIELNELERYNKWLSAPSVPSDKAYTVLVPMTYQNRSTVLAQNTTAAPEAAPAETVPVQAGKFVTQNGLKAVVAFASDTKDRLAIKGGIKTKKFLKYNDLRSFDQIEEGKTYYLEAKKSKATVDFYTAQVGETLREIAQRFGVKEKALRSKNRMKAEEVLVAGRVLWMQRTRPRQVPVEYRKVLDPNEEPGLLAQNTVKGPNTDLTAAPAPADQPAAATTPANPEPVATAAEPAVKPAATLPAAMPATDPKTAAKPAAAPATPKPAAQPSPALMQKPAAAEPAAARPAAAQSETVVEHTVARGESMFSIARKYGTTVDSLKAWNSTGSTALITGQKLKVTPAANVASAKPAAPAVMASAATPASGTAAAPAPKPAAPAATTPEPVNAPAAATHTVGKGETMYQIARQYGITVIDLMDLNGKTDTNLKPGEILTVKKK